jgi:hypothetical protein
MKEIGICVGHKNRSEALLGHLIESMNECIYKDRLRLSVFDCGTEGDILGEIQEHWKGSLEFRQKVEPFTRTHSLNEAVEQCPSDFIFLCDADMTLPRDFPEQFHENVGRGKVWFPICYSMRKGKHRSLDPRDGWWRDSGMGMAGFYKPDFEQVGAMNIEFRKWGDEDYDLHERCVEAGYEIVREKCVGLFHNWHKRRLFGIDVV